ncbi:ABC transporter ATP-binding protein [Anaerolineales bacterium HSG25]|nr:ABC transporter ATP-binding protein [Anaerolineales bacterium HSG25]
MQTTSEFSVQRQWQPNHSTPWRWVMSHAMQYKIYIIGVIIGAFGNGIGAGILPMFIGWGFQLVIDTADDPDFYGLGLIAFWLIVSQLIRGVLMMGRNFCSEIIGQRVELNTRDELYLSLIGKSMSFHDSHAAGELMARATNDVREINFMFNPGLNLVIGSIFFIVAPIILVPYIHPQLLLSIGIYIVFYVISLWHYLRELQPVTEKERLEFGKLNATLAEGIDGIETVKGAAQEVKEISRFNTALSNWRQSFVAQGDVQAKFYPLLLLGLLQAAALLHSLLLYQQGAISEGDVISFNSMIMIFGFPTFAAQFAYSRVSIGLSSAQRVLDLITTTSELDQNVGGYTGELDGSLHFDNVTFRYNSSHNTDNNTGQEQGKRSLEHVSFEIKPGQTVAITGQTGSGKSTIAKLINRTYDIDEGEVVIGGVNVKAWNLESLRQQISIIEQDIYLFSRSVADNIAFGCPDATREAIISAAKAAQAHDFIMGFRDNYDTMVGERGVTLSGGQRQRLALARAFLTNPRILVLDDATSAIDSATEDRIQRAIERAAQDRTTILITHRLSQIRWADLIIVLRKGKIAMIGDHDTLMEESEAYRNIFARYQ